MAANIIKIRTHPPLGPFQAWVPFDPDQTIHSLKLSIINLLQSTTSISINSQDILLELDVFACKIDSACWSIDPNLIDAKAAPNRKRSRSLTEPKPDTNVSFPSFSIEQTRQQCVMQSSHSPKIGPEPQLPENKLLEPNSMPNSNQPRMPQAPCKPPAPPGQGKASTKSCNKRRKMKKIRAREQNQQSRQEAGKMIEDNSNQETRHSSLISDHQYLNSPHLTDGMITQENYGDSYLPSTKDQSNSATTSHTDQSSILGLPNDSLVRTESASARPSSLLDTLSVYISRIQ